MTEQLTSVRFPRETIALLKELAELNDGSVAAEIRQAVDAYIQACTSAPDFADRVAAKRQEREVTAGQSAARLLELAAAVTSKR